MRLPRFSLRQKIVLIGVSQLVVVGGVLFGLYYRDARAKIREKFTEKARAVILTTEATRTGMATKWDEGLFSKAQLRAWADAGEVGKILEAVPVVSAWKAAMANAEAGGYTFRVPKFEPRNPDNAPDPVEADVLRRFSAENLEEYWLVDEELNAIRYFRPIRLTEDCLVCHGDPATSAELWGNSQGLDPTGSPMENWQVGEVHGAFEVVQSLDAADAQLAASLWRGAGLTAALIAAGALLLYWLVTRNIIRPVREMVTVSRAVAAGDLTVRTNIQQEDEIGELAGTLNASTSSLHELATGLRRASHTLTAFSGSLASTAGALSSGAHETTDQSATVAAAGEEMSANMRQMADSSEAMSRNANDAATSVEQMSQAIEEVARSSEQTAGVADEASRLAESSTERIMSLGESADAIGSVIGVIQEIAEQTNLLALNATIEAARAGEAGKGFTVVATEVKELARQTGEATEDIRRRIEGIQGTSTDAIAAIKAISEVVGRVHEASRTIAAAVEEQTITTRQISENVAQTADAAGVVATNVQESSLATREIAESIVRVDENARRTADSAGQAEASSRELSTLAAEFEQLTSQFKLRED